jgi:hypothetical protein
MRLFAETSALPSLDVLVSGEDELFRSFSLLRYLIRRLSEASYGRSKGVQDVDSLHDLRLLKRDFSPPTTCVAFLHWDEILVIW